MALRYVQDIFSSSSNPTIGASFLTKRVILNGSKIKLQLWDTAGQERFRSLAPMYYRGALAALLVYDVTNVESFEEVKGWAEELRTNVEANLIVVVVGNKIDLAKHRVVTERQGKTFADSIGALFFETSARENVGIDPLFLEVCKKLLIVSRENVAPDAQVVRAGSGSVPDKDSGGCPC